MRLEKGWCAGFRLRAGEAVVRSFTILSLFFVKKLEVRLPYVPRVHRRASIKFMKPIASRVPPREKFMLRDAGLYGEIDR